MSGPARGSVTPGSQALNDGHPRSGLPTKLLARSFWASLCGRGGVLGPGPAASPCRDLLASGNRNGVTSSRRSERSITLTSDQVFQQFAEAPCLEVRHNAPGCDLASLPLHPGLQELAGIRGRQLHRRHTTRAGGPKRRPGPHRSAGLRLLGTSAWAPTLAHGGPGSGDPRLRLFRLAGRPAPSAPLSTQHARGSQGSCWSADALGW
jgi:hypothetical protein